MKLKKRSKNAEESEKIQSVKETRWILSKRRINNSNLIVAIQEVLQWIRRHYEKLFDERFCIRCGECCLYHPVHHADEDDLESWEGKLVKYGRKIYPLMHFVNRDSGYIWIHPETGLEFYRCPFLKKKPHKTSYTCLIHRPDIIPNECSNLEATIENVASCKGVQQYLKAELGLHFKTKTIEAKFFVILGTLLMRELI